MIHATDPGTTLNTKECYSDCESQYGCGSIDWIPSKVRNSDVTSQQLISDFDIKYSTYSVLNREDFLEEDSLTQNTKLNSEILIGKKISAMVAIRDWARIYLMNETLFYKLKEIAHLLILIERNIKDIMSLVPKLLNTAKNIEQESALSLSQNLNTIWGQANTFYGNFKNSEYFQFHFLPDEIRNVIIDSPQLIDFHIQLATLFRDEVFSSKHFTQENSGLEINTKCFRNIADLFTSLELKITNLLNVQSQYLTSWKMLQNGIRELRDKITGINEDALAFKRVAEESLENFKQTQLKIKLLSSDILHNEAEKSTISTDSLVKNKISSTIRYL